jgi:hypothetical protein
MIRPLGIPPVYAALASEFDEDGWTRLLSVQPRDRRHVIRLSVNSETQLALSVRLEELERMQEAIAKYVRSVKENLS